MSDVANQDCGHKKCEGEPGTLNGVVVSTLTCHVCALEKAERELADEKTTIAFEFAEYKKQALSRIEEVISERDVERAATVRLGLAWKAAQDAYALVMATTKR